MNARIRVIAWDGFPNGLFGDAFTVDGCKDGGEVLARFDADTEGEYGLVVLDYDFREYCEPLLVDLRELGLYPHDVLKSALPALAVPDYYFVRDRFCLLPFRFGTNGVVCTAGAVKKLRDERDPEVLVPHSATGARSLNLDALLLLIERYGASAGIELCVWGWDEAVNQLLERSAGTPRDLEACRRRLARAVALTGGSVLADFSTMRTKLEEELEEDDSRATVIVGPSEMVAAPLRNRGVEVDWFLIAGAGVLWMELIGVSKRWWVAQGSSALAQQLNEVVHRLNKDGFHFAAPVPDNGAYWGYPVLGWGDSPSDPVRDGMKRMGAAERLGTTAAAQRPAEVLSDLVLSVALNGVGVAFREAVGRGGTQLVDAVNEEGRGMLAVADWAMGADLVETEVWRCAGSPEADIACKRVWEATRAAEQADAVTDRLMSVVVDQDRDSKTRPVAAAMLAPFCQKGKPELVERLRDQMVATWDKADPSVKFRLFWNLLDCNVDSGIVQFDNWWHENLSVWVVETLRWFGGAERVLPGVRYRLRQATETKKTWKTWAYLAQTVASYDGAGIRALLREHESSADLFVRRVVEEVRGILDKAESVVLRAATDERTRPAR